MPLGRVRAFVPPVCPPKAGADVSLSTDDLLKPQERVFTKKKRNYGIFSILVAAASVLVLLPVYASFVGLLVPLSWVMVVAAVFGAVFLPWLLAWKLRSRGPRLFALVNVVLAAFFFTVLGGSTDRALASNGAKPFESLAGLLGASEGEQHAVTVSGELVIGVLRALTLGGLEEDVPDRVDDDGSGDYDDEAPVGLEAEPRAETEPASGVDSGPMEEGHRDNHEPGSDGDWDDDEPGIQAFIDLTSIGSSLLDEAGKSHQRASLASAAGDDRTLRGEGAADIVFSDGTEAVTVDVVLDNEVSAGFVFDTGADFTAITPALARRLGVDPETLTEKRTLLTAGGPVEDPVVRVDSLAVDGAEVRDLEVVVCMRCPNNLLGRNFYGRFHLEIDSKAGFLRLLPR